MTSGERRRSRVLAEPRTPKAEPRTRIASSGPGGTGRPAAGAPPLWRELLGGLIVFAIYSVVAGLDWSGRAAAADAHGRALFGLERALRLDLELSLNHWLVPHVALRTAANYEYAVTYVGSALALLAWLYLRRPAT